MVEVEEIIPGVPTTRKKQFGWLLSTLIQPRKAMNEIAREDRSVWLLPVILLSMLVIVHALVAGPLLQQAAQNAVTEPPESFQWMTPDQQEQYMQAQQSKNGPMTTTVFPALGALAGVWLGWFILGSILHLTLTMFGSRSTSITDYNITAWASLPFAIRLIVQIVAMLATDQLIHSPGLSGFITPEPGQALLFARSLLRLVDIYLIWQIILLTIGASATSGLPRGKTFLGVFIAALLLLLVSALVVFLFAQIGGLNVTQPFIFF